MNAQFIGVDWGSTNFRAYLVDQQGAILGKKEAPCGMLSVQPDQFAETLHTQVHDWLASHPGITILMTGMVGARQGWVEADYVHCPVTLDQLSGQLTHVHFDKNHPTFIVPGLAMHDVNEPDVMRGEETQLLGAIPKDSVLDIFCMPGTHSKWVHVDKHRVTRFRTFMTGEIFSLLEKHSMLSKQMHATIEEDAFAEGVEHAKAQNGLLTDLFKIRAAAVLGFRDEAFTYSYLSGLLIGYEIQEAQAYWQPHKNLPVYIVAAEPMATWYLKALSDFHSCHAIKVDPERAVVAGLTKIYNTL